MPRLLHSSRREHSDAPAVAPGLSSPMLLTVCSALLSEDASDGVGDDAEQLGWFYIEGNAEEPDGGVAIDPPRHHPDVRYGDLSNPDSNTVQAKCAVQLN